MKRKMKGVLLIAVFILSTITLAIPVSANPDLTVVLSGIPSTATHTSIELTTIGDGTAGWTTDIPNPTGANSHDLLSLTKPFVIKLTMPESGAVDADSASVKVYYGKALDTITNPADFTFHILTTDPHTPYGIFYLDTTGDGLVDRLLISAASYYDQSETMLPINEWSEVEWFDGDPIGWKIQLYDPVTGIRQPRTLDWDDLEYWKTEYSTATIIYAAAEITYLDTSAGDSVYIDDFTIGGETYALEASGNVEDTITVSGTSTTPGGLIEVYWDSVKTWDGIAGLLESDYAVGYDYSIDITVPEGIVGDHYVIVKDVEAPATALATMITEPEIVLDPITALALDTITVEGTGFAEEAPISINFDGGDAETTVPALVETDALGSFSCTFDVPSGTTADGDVVASDSVNSATETLSVGATIALDPAEGPSGAVVDISGIGFEPVDEITVTFDGGSVYWEGVAVTALVVNGEGIFSGQFIVPTKSVGEYTVTATDEHATSGTSDFEVTGTTAITLTPIIGAPDSDVIIEGVNFTATADTEVTIDFGTIYTEYVTFYTNDTGGFREILTVPFLEVGTEDVTATDENGLEDTAVYTIAIGIIILDENEGHTGTDISVTAYGFTGTDYNVTFGNILVLLNDADGVHTFTVPTVPMGEYTVTVEDDLELMASETFTVNATTELTLDPETAPVGYVVSIVGDYFSPGSTIEVILYNSTNSWELGTDITIPGDLVADVDGTFEATFEVPAVLDLGDYLFNATDPTIYPPDDEKLINVLELPFSVVEPYIDIHTVSTAYEPEDTVSFYVNSTFDYDLTIDVDDPTGYPITTIDCPKTGDSVWVRIGDFYVVPYAVASFVLPGDAEIGTWNWTAFAASEAVANGTFTVGVEPEEPEPEPVTDITLSEGWNLVSLPLIPTDPSVTVVLSGLVGLESVWSYDATTEQWSSYSPGAPSDLTEMVDGYGYWIEMSASATLSVSGTEMPVDPFDPLPAYPVVEGYNLMGFKSTTPMTVAEYLLGVDYVRVYEYVAGYNSLSAGEDMTPGRGYWISVSAPGTIYP